MRCNTRRKQPWHADARRALPPHTDSLPLWLPGFPVPSVLLSAGVVCALLTWGQVQRAHAGAATACVFTASDRTLVTASDDGCLFQFRYR
jgi:hypothetical protein